jgi:hydrogenase maturation protease
MNDELIDLLAPLCGGTTAFLAIGNPDRGDDGAGIVLARRLREAGIPFIIEGGMTPERVLPQVRDLGCETVVFLDAADFGAEPGAVVVMDAEQVAGRFPQISTHKLSLGTLASLVKGDHGNHVYLVGIQPASIEIDGGGLSDAVAAAVDALAREFVGLLLDHHPNAGERVCL